MRKRKDLIGKKFGRLTVIEFAEVSHSLSKWRCKCDCGNITDVYRGALISGNTQSCGCYNKQRIKETQTKLDGSPAIKALYYDYKKSAKRRKYEFSLTIEQFRIIIQQECFYCGEKPSRVYDKEGTFSVGILCNGIDRLNNNLGYIRDNCVSCCKICNYAKRDMNVEEFDTWIRKVYLRRNTN